MLFGTSFLLAIGLLLVVLSVITSTVIISKEGSTGEKGLPGPRGTEFPTLLDTDHGGTNSSRLLLGGKLIVSSTKDSMVEGPSATNPVVKSLILEANQNQMLFGVNNLISAFSVDTPTVDRVVTIPNVGANAEVVLSEGDQPISGEKSFNQILVKDVLLVDDVLQVSKQLQTQGNLLISNANSTTDSSLAITNTNPASVSESASLLIQGNSTLSLTPALIKQTGLLGQATYENQTTSGIEFSSETDTFLTLSDTGSLLIPNATNQLSFGNGFGVQLSVTPSILTPTYTLPDVSVDASIVLSEGSQIIYGQKTCNNLIAKLSAPARNPNTVNQLVLGSPLSSTTISAPSLLADKIITLADPGVPAANFMLTEGNQTINGRKSVVMVLGNLPNITLTSTSNQIGLGAASHQSTINAPSPAASRVYTVPDTLVNSNFVMTEGDQTINGSKTVTLFATTDLVVNNLICDDATLGAPVNQIQLGPSGELKLNAPLAPAPTRYDIPGAVSNMEFVMTAGDQTIRGVKNFVSGLICLQNLNINGSLTAGTVTTLSITRQMSMISPPTIPAVSTLTLSLEQTDDAQGWPDSPSPLYLVFPQKGRYACSYGLNFPQHNEGAVFTYMMTDLNEIFGSMKGDYTTEGFSLSLCGYATISTSAGSRLRLMVNNQTELDMTMLNGGVLVNVLNAYYLGSD